MLSWGPVVLLIYIRNPGILLWIRIQMLRSLDPDSDFKTKLKWVHIWGSHILIRIRIGTWTRTRSPLFWHCTMHDTVLCLSPIFIDIRKTKITILCHRYIQNICYTYACPLYWTDSQVQDNNRKYELAYQNMSVKSMIFVEIIQNRMRKIIFSYPLCIRYFLKCPKDTTLRQSSFHKPDEKSNVISIPGRHQMSRIDIIFALHIPLLVWKWVSDSQSSSISLCLCPQYKCETWALTDLDNATFPQEFLVGFLETSTPGKTL